MRNVLLAALCLAATSCATDEAEVAKSQQQDARDLAQALAGRSPGKTADCVSTFGLSGPEIIGDTLLYSDMGVVWRSDLDSCPGLRRDSVLVVQLYGTRMCNRDRFTVVDRGSRFPGATCLMGPFTPYSRPKKS